MVKSLPAEEQYPLTEDLIDELSLVNDVTWSGYLSTRYNMIGMIEDQIDWPIAYGQKTNVRRKARMAWLSHVLQRQINSTKEMSGRECLLVWRWLNGLTNIVDDDPGGFDDELAEERQIEVYNWMECRKEDFV
jgi:hypothetical protein